MLRLLSLLRLFDGLLLFVESCLLRLSLRLLTSILWASVVTIEFVILLRLRL